MNAGFPAHQFELSLGPGRRLRQVLVGPFDNVGRVEAILAQIRQIPGYQDAFLRNAPNRLVRP